MKLIDTYPWILRTILNIIIACFLCLGASWLIEWMVMKRIDEESAAQFRGWLASMPVGVWIVLCGGLLWIIIGISIITICSANKKSKTKEEIETQGRG